MQLKEAFVHWLKGIALTVGRWKSASWIKPDFYRDLTTADGQLVSASPVDDAEPNDQLNFKKIVRHIFRYGFIEIADDILFALLVGVALGGLLYLAIPSDLVSNEYARWISYPIMVLFGAPLYICASARL